MTCRNCNSKFLHQIIDLGKHIPSNFYISKKNINKNIKKYPLILFVCKKCWLVQIKDFLKGKDLFKSDYAYMSGFSQIWKNHCLKYSEYVIKNFKIQKEDMVVEIASNDGTLLDYFHKKQIKCLGIDPTRSTSLIAKEKGIKTIIDFFNEKTAIKIKKKNSAIKLIIANNVIAHVEDINSFAKGLSILSSDKTIITLEFQYIEKLIKNKQFDTIYHEHFSYYSLISITSLLKKYDLKIFKVQKINTHGGSLRIFACKNASNFKIENSVINQLNKELILGINSISYYDDFRNVVSDLRNKTQKKINKINSQGKTIIAYGAAAKGNTFINYCNFSSKDILAIVDKNPFKTNKYSPGGLIPIRPISYINRFKPDYILILPWNIKNEIIQQLSFVRLWSCKFIIAVPKLLIK